MLGLIRRSLSDLFDFPPIKLELPSLSPTKPSFDDSLRDLDFDIYEYEYEEKKNYEFKPFSFDSYDWAFSFREAAKSQQKVILEVSVERLPKDYDTSISSFETCCLPVSPSISPTNTTATGAMTLLRGTSTSTSTSATPRTPTFTETSDLISEEEQNMILAAIIASQCDDFDRQIPRHVRDEMEHAEYIAALEESRELANQAEPQASAAAAPSRRAAPPPTTRLPPTLNRAATFAPVVSPPNREPHSPDSAGGFRPKSLTRSNTDIPWTNQEGEHVDGESEKQARFRELLQFHAIQAASIANASARTGVSNISGNDEAFATDYDWI
ncbi:hypothetical protein ABW20_dc0107111 [Dactylellina cionopaga]|nr:hypothetical protein ABW20_dc0107111 [Dactylellina cionopaga]